MNVECQDEESGDMTDDKTSETKPSQQGGPKPGSSDLPLTENLNTRSGQSSTKGKATR